MTVTSALLEFVQHVRSHWIPPHEVRREALALGGRHRGEILQGARKEAALPDVPFRRAILLRAVIRGESMANKAAGPGSKLGRTYPGRQKR
jgi:hypothetical protein